MATIVPIAIAARIPPLFRQTAQDQARSFLNRLDTGDLSWAIRHKPNDNVPTHTRTTPRTMTGPFAELTPFGYCPGLVDWR